MIDTAAQIGRLGNYRVQDWDARFATMSTKALLVETCARRLPGMFKLSRDDMRLFGYSDDQSEIDVCERAIGLQLERMRSARASATCPLLG
jgi:hypothetical protein